MMGLFLIILNYTGFDPLAGVYSLICFVTAMVLLINEHMKGPTIRFGPNEKSKAYSYVVKIIEGASSYLKVIDVHPGLDTLSALTAAPEGVPVQFLTLPQNVWKGKDAFLAAAKRYLDENKNLEIRIADKSVFHDRWILTEPKGFHLTQSIQHIGNKIGSIIDMSIAETDECVEEFDEYWSMSEPLGADSP